MMEIKLKLLNDYAKVPTRGSEQAAGYDLHAAEGVVIKPGETALIGTGTAVAIPEGYFGGIYARSGLSIKQGLRPANCVGVIDSDYRGELIVALHNDSSSEKEVNIGDRIAQLIIQPFIQTTFKVCNELDDTVRGEGGFGSTGTN